MRRILLSVLLVGAVFVGTGAIGASAVSICLRASPSCQPPSIVSTFGGSVLPQRLPAGEHAPVAWTAFGKIATTTGNHPPALREIEVEIDKEVKLNHKGYPSCRFKALRRARSIGEARDICAGAVLGAGEAHVEVAFPDEEPIELAGRLLFFNGGETGHRIRLLVHASGPEAAAAVIPIAVTKRGSGLHARVEIPRIAGGNGSLLDFKFRLGKTFEYKGKEVGYFEARCPDDVFKVSFSKMLFKNETGTPGEAASTQLKGSLAVPCTGRRQR